MAREVRVGLIGFGTIGTGVVKLLQRNQAQIRTRLGARLTLARIADIDLRTDRGVKVDRRILTNDAAALLDDPSIDIVIELMGGYEPARRFVLRAIANGKSVVTANKALLAVHGAEIFRAVEKAGVDVGYEASVGGGIPIIRTLKEGLAADRNRAIYGIVNGTSNYILSTMTQQGGEFDVVLKEAQRQGLAEANPTYDVDGIDAAHKLTLLIQLAFGTRVRCKDIPVEGMRHVTQLDINFAREFGYVVKLLAIAKQDGNGIEARVHPTMVPRQHLLADVSGAYNAIAVQGEALGASMYFGLGAGMMPTATAVVADLMDVARNLLGSSRGRVAPLGYPLAQQRRVALKSIDDLVTEYYLRFMVVDRPGVLAKISGILGMHDISIASVIQKEREHGASVPIVIRTHQALERNLRKALKAIDRLAAVRAKSVLIRIEDSLGQ
ncbi:MAG TPA: homoserine dehydrogenase [Candidatus Margulisiibacteriota bacterium]|nr:homoserine dehydrogenase [Candidatus Margulisiibacteriota bacterium]